MPSAAGRGSLRSNRSARRTTPSIWPPVSSDCVSRAPASSRIDDKAERPSAEGESLSLIRQFEQVLGVAVRDLFFVDRGDRHLFKELPTGFHAGERIVGGEKDSVDTD